MRARVSSHTSGQAMLEFVVGLVATLCVIGAMIQLGLLALERSTAMVDATGEAAEKSIEPDFTLLPTDYTQNWREGADAFRHSADDTQESGDPSLITEQIGEAALPSRIRAYDDDSPLAHADDPERLVEQDALVKGSASKVGIRLLPVVRKWLYRRDTLTVRAESWSVWTTGVY